jgi:hypothetical protein
VEAKYVDKAVASVKYAVKVLDDVLQALMNGDHDSVRLKLWQAAAESEYASFVLSIMCGFSELDPDVGGLNLKGTSLESIVTAAQSILSEAADIVKINPREAYEKVRRAVYVLREAQSTRAER